MAESSRPDDPSKDREPTDGEVEATIVGQHREMYDDRLGPASRKKTIFDFYKNRLIQANKEKQEKFQRELEKTGEALDFLRRAREKNKDDPDMLATFPPDNAPAEQLLAWYKEARKPNRNIPFANPSEDWLRQDRISRAIQSGQRPDPEDLAEEEAEKVRHQRKVAEAFESKRKQLETEQAQSKFSDKDESDVSATAKRVGGKVDGGAKSIDERRARPGAGEDPRSKGPTSRRSIPTTRNGSSFYNPPRRSPSEEVIDEVLELFRDHPEPPPAESKPSESHPQRRSTLTTSEKVGFWLAFGSVAAGFIIGALAAAGIINMGLAQLMLLAALIVMTAGAFLVEFLSARSGKRIAVSTVVTAAVSGLLLFGVISPWMVRKKTEQDARAAQQEKTSQAQVPEHSQRIAERPYFKIIVGISKIAIGEKPTAKVTLENVGKTPAHHFKVRSAIILAPTNKLPIDLQERLYRQGSSILNSGILGSEEVFVPVGGFIHGLPVLPEPLTAVYMKGIRGKHISLHVYVWGTYQDELKTIRSIEYCTFYDPDIPDFLRPCSEHNQSEQ